MCGIAGFFTPSGFNKTHSEVIANKMRDLLYHRGPDDSGTWIDSDAGIALVHRRLSIIDLSMAGHQPMISASGRYVIVFNGEVYNHQEIRKKLINTSYHAWNGHSDTETLLSAIEIWGLEETLKCSVGMFALALWDRKEHHLALARDRMGEKPLYYGWQSGTFLFGSELKSLSIHPAFCRELDRDILPVYLRHGYIPAPWCVWRGIRKLKPGTIVRISAKHCSNLPEPISYWSLTDIIKQEQTNIYNGSDIEAIDGLEAILKNSINQQMVADVPVGAFLSGGVDSSAIVALMQAQSIRPVKTFTIGFREDSYNEAHHAKAVAAYLGTDHTELYLSAEQAMDVIPNLPYIYDEPFADSSAISTHLVSYLTKQHVTISLSGDGGDELFGGYGRYYNVNAEKRWMMMRNLPIPLVSVLRRVFNNGMISRSSIGAKFESRIQLILNLASCQVYTDYYRMMTSHWALEPVNFHAELKLYGCSEYDLIPIADHIHQMMAVDSCTYLPDDILVKVDRAAMAVSLETRVPILDHRVVEYAWHLPLEYKVRNGEGKWVLRQLLYRYVPKKLIDRPKMGFGVPVDQWLRGSLKEWAEDLLSEKKLKSSGLLNVMPIRKRWQQHLKGHVNWKDSLWLILMWQAWLDENAI